MRRRLSGLWIVIICLHAMKIQVGRSSESVSEGSSLCPLHFEGSSLCPFISKAPAFAPSFCLLIETGGKGWSLRLPTRTDS
jgi:hypothetical protein